MRQLWILPVLSLLLACGGGPQAAPQKSAAPESVARKRSHKQRANSAKFDFYVLSLSWSPQHCAAARGGRGGEIQCAGNRPFDFVLHGMWPQYEKGWPEDCSTQPVDAGTVDSMLDIMPSPQLVRHEWSKHGTCSGLAPKDYFVEAREMFGAVKIPREYKQPRAQVVTSPDEVRQRFAAANPDFPANGFAVVCSGRFLQEVRACLTADFEPRACNREVLGSQCRADEIIMRPVR